MLNSRRVTSLTIESSVYSQSRVTKQLAYLGFFQDDKASESQLAWLLAVVTVKWAYHPSYDFVMTRFRCEIAHARPCQ